MDSRATEQLGHVQGAGHRYRLDAWDLDQDRLHNKANEIDNDDDHSNSPVNTITASPGTNWADPLQDAAGNMTTIPQPGSWSSSYDLTYDAWNRLVRVQDGSDVDTTIEYDGLGRRVEREPRGQSIYFGQMWFCFVVCSRWGSEFVERWGIYYGYSDVFVDPIEAAV